MFGHWLGLRVNRALSISATILAIWCAMFDLVACGGGGSDKTGGPPCNGTYLGQGICIGPSIYTLGGTASGLAGFGLSLLPSGDLAGATVQIPSNGSLVSPG